ncbi:MAG: dockerin type I domain-containing protein, partial [Singulisphaera sp.]
RGSIVTPWSVGNRQSSSSSLDLEFKYSLPNGTIGSNIQYTGGLQVVVHAIVGNHGTSSLGTWVTLNNADTVPITTDGYTLQSAGGHLSVAGFRGFAGHGGTGWEVVNSSSNALSELNLSSATTLAPGAAQLLGAPFVGGQVQDLTFNYSMPDHGVWNGDVVYQIELAGDANHDGINNSQDIALVSSNWLQTNVASGDVNYDGIVNGQDLAMISSRWLDQLGGGANSAAATTAVPEPASGSAMVVGTIICYSLCRTSRRR